MAHSLRQSQLLGGAEGLAKSHTSSLTHFRVYHFRDKNGEARLPKVKYYNAGFQ
jgi:hypothetical protein